MILAAVIAASLTAVAAADASRRGDCSSRACVERVKARWLDRHYQRQWRSAPATVRAHLRRIALCESGGNERAVSPGGAYRGLVQFAPATWRAVGGRGDPAAASRWEQWARAARLYIRAGPGQWPVCGHR